MISRLEVETLLRSLYTARVSGDFEGVCKIFTENARFEILSAGNRTPLAVKAKGAAEIRALMKLLIKTFRIGEEKISSMIIDGSKVAVHWQASVYSRITGQTVPTEFIDIVEIHDGQISSYREFVVPG